MTTTNNDSLGKTQHGQTICKQEEEIWDTDNSTSLTRPTLRSKIESNYCKHGHSTLHNIWLLFYTKDSALKRFVTWAHVHSSVTPNAGHTHHSPLQTSQCMPCWVNMAGNIHDNYKKTSMIRDAVRYYQILVFMLWFHGSKCNLCQKIKIDFHNHCF